MSLSKFDTAVGLIYRAALEPAVWPSALDAIAACTGDEAAVLLYGRDDGGFGVIESPSINVLVHEYLRDGWNFRDVRANRCRERGYFVSRDVITDRDILTEEEIAADPFYADLLARYGYRYFAAAMVTPNKRVEVAISVQRRFDRPPFAEDELRVVARLGAHVEQSLRLGIQLLETRSLNEGLSEALTRVGVGVFILDSSGQVIFSNEAARELAGEIDAVKGRLSVRDASGARALTSLIGQYLDSSVPEAVESKPILVSRAGSSRPLALYAFPVSEANSLDSFLAQAKVVVLLVDSNTDDPPDPSMIRDLMGLTLSEARIASLIGSGLPPKQAAERLGIAEETARSVLKRVFAKVGVSRQSELVSLMTRLMLR